MQIAKADSGRILKLSGALRIDGADELRAALLDFVCAASRFGDGAGRLRQPLLRLRFRDPGHGISTKVLNVARAAVYRESQILPVPADFRRKYLLRGRSKVERLARVVPELRRKVSLHPLNLMDDDYGIQEVFDVVLFRNVMIYFDKNTQEAVINKICRNLAPGGYLFAGHSESLAGLDVPVRHVQTAIYRKAA